MAFIAPQECIAQSERQSHSFSGPLRLGSDWHNKPRELSCPLCPLRLPPSAYSGCAHATAGKPARHAQSSYATHPWVATPIAPISADTTTITAPTCCQRVSVSPKYLTSIGLPSQ